MNIRRSSQWWHVILHIRMMEGLYKYFLTITQHQLRLQLVSLIKAEQLIILLSIPMIRQLVRRLKSVGIMKDEIEEQTKEQATVEVVVAEVHSWRKSRLHHHPPTNINRNARQQSYQQFLLRQLYKQFLRRLWHHPSLQEEEAEEAVATEAQSNPQTNIEVRQSKYVIQQLLFNFLTNKHKRFLDSLLSPSKQSILISVRGHCRPSRTQLLLPREIYSPQSRLQQ